MRGSFRRGIALGLLVGTAATAVKTVLDRRSPRPATPSGPSPEPWEPLSGTTPVQIPEPIPEPDIDVHVAPGPEPQPARPARKAAAKKAPAKKKRATESTPLAPWVDPLPDGTSPETHPVKAKMASGIYHVPGGFNYARTRPDRCYIDAAAAEADGLRPAKR